MVDAIISFALAALPGAYALFMLKTGEVFQWSWGSGQVTREDNPYSFWSNVVGAIAVSLILLAGGVYSVLNCAAQ